MSQAPKTLCLIQFWSWLNSLFPLLALWGNKNWSPSMKVKKLTFFLNKSGLKGCKWSRMDAPGTGNPLCHSILKLGEFPFPIYWPSGVLRIGLPVWKRKSWKTFKTKVAQRVANGPDWMSLALKPLCLIQFWSWLNSLFPLLALWGNKNWSPSMKVKKMENFRTKGMQMVQFECPRHWKPSVSSTFGVGRIPFSQYCPPRIGLPVWQ